MLTDRHPTLTPLARRLLWDYERGSATYLVLCAILLALLFGMPAPWWGPGGVLP